MYFFLFAPRGPVSEHHSRIKFVSFNPHNGDQTATLYIKFQLNCIQPISLFLVKELTLKPKAEKIVGRLPWDSLKLLFK